MPGKKSRCEGKGCCISRHYRRRSSANMDSRKRWSGGNQTRRHGRGCGDGVSSCRLRNDSWSASNKRRLRSRGRVLSTCISTD
jgi:hypothetical protein